jgi:hypothetical protein
LRLSDTVTLNNKNAKYTNGSTTTPLITDEKFISE